MNATDSAFHRLRAANPVPQGSAVEAAALFDRITALPGGGGHPPRALWSRRPVLVLVLALAAGALLAATATALSNWFGDVIGAPQVNSEYSRAQTRLALPPGYAWPELHFPANSVTSRGAGGSYAVAIAQSAWECDWVRAIGVGDAVEQRRAHEALDELMANHAVVAPAGASENWAPPRSARTPTEVFADDGGFQYKERSYREAAAGHPQLLEQSCRANAPPGWHR